MQKSSQGQHAALAALVQNVNFLMPSDETLVSTDIRADPDFWALLRQLLVSSAITSTAAVSLTHILYTLNIYADLILPELLDPCVKRIK